MFRPSHPSIGAARKKEGENPRASSGGEKTSGLVGLLPAGPPPGPAVKTRSPRLSPRGADAPSVAFGLGLRILAAGPAVLRQYSLSRGAVRATPKLLAMTPEAGPRDARSPDLTVTPSRRQRRQCSIGRGERSRHHDGRRAARSDRRRTQRLEIARRGAQSLPDCS